MRSWISSSGPVNEVLESEFQQTLGSRGVHIIDPFTGTGTFVTRLLQSGLIKPEELAHKYHHEIHANEVALLAYYIAAINIETVYHDLVCGDYMPFPGICLTDTFQLYERDDLVSVLLKDNSTRRVRQRALDIRVVIGNPPYSEGQESGNDNAQNIEYPALDGRIRATYGARSTAALQNSLFNSYVRAIRWASDRIGTQGVVAFISAAGWVTGNSLDGLRKCLVDEFSSIHVFHLRGNARTKGERRRKEKDNVFGQQSKSPIAITVLVKNPTSEARGSIRFHDIGDYLGREEKLSIVKRFGSIGGINKIDGWKPIVPDQHGDWLSQRSVDFGNFIKVASKERGEQAVFADLSSGIKTNRDPWCYNASRSVVSANMKRLIEFYNNELFRYHQDHPPSAAHRPEPADVVNKDPTKIKWTREIFASLKSGRRGEFFPDHVVQSAYRPFSKQWAYFDRHFNNCVYQMPKIFPRSHEKNLAIAVAGPGAQDFSALMVDCVPEYAFQFNGVCLPLKRFEACHESASESWLDNDEVAPPRHVITDAMLTEARAAYANDEITKDDLFYYVYALLHSEDYRERYADNLSKELPRIP